MARARNTAAAIAGLAALAALMGRKGEDRVPVEDRTPSPGARSEDDEYDKFRPTKTQYGAFGEPPTDTSRTLEDAPQSEKGRVAPARPTVPRPVARAPVDAATARRLDSLAALRRFEQGQEAARERARQERLMTPGYGAVEQDLDVLTPFPGLGRVGTAARALARGTPELTGPAARPLLEGPARREMLTGPAKREALEGPPKRELLTYDPRKARAAAMEEAKPVLQARPGKKSPRETTRFKEDETNVEFKKGGKTKKMASGGMAKSSASKRADGMAVRGKTRCKVY